MSHTRGMLPLLLLVFALVGLAACREGEIPVQPTTAPAVDHSGAPTAVPTAEMIATETVEVPTETVNPSPEPVSTAVPAEPTVEVTKSFLNGDGLEVIDNKIYFNAEPIKLRCFSIGEIAEFNMPEFSWTDPRIQFKEMKGWGGNCVRLSVHPGFWETQNESERALLRELIDIATEEEMFVIVDWHVIGWPGTFSATDNWHPDMNLYNSDFNLAKAFWSEISEDYKDYNNIVLEIWNEAIHPDAMDELPEQSWWPVLKIKHEELIMVIRENGNSSPILVSAPSWSYDLRGIKDDPPYDPYLQLAYSWHVYAGNGCNYQGELTTVVPGESTCDSPEVWEIALDDLNEVAPVILGEWGFEEETNQHWQGTEKVYGERMKQFILDKDLHPVAWNWNPYYGPSLWTEQDASRMSQWGLFVYNFYQELEQ